MTDARKLLSRADVERIQAAPKKATDPQVVIEALCDTALHYMGTGYVPSEARAIVEKHRRHVELSPGVGEDVQKYALAVCDDILSDLPISGGGTDD